MVRFEGWFTYEEFKEYSRIDLPGVYVVAKFKKRPTTVDLLDKNIAYIGETCGGSLKKRITNFFRAAKKGKAPHSGGKTYFKTFKVNEEKSDVSDVYFAIKTFPKKDLSDLEIRYLERKLILEHAKKNGKKLLNLK